VVNTRALSQAGELDRVLEAHGATPLSFPCIAIGPAPDVATLDGAIGRLGEGGFDWVVLTSVNTVEAVAERLADLHRGDSARLCRGALLRLPASASDTFDGDRPDRCSDPIGPSAGASDVAWVIEQVRPRTTQPQRGSPTGIHGLRHQASEGRPELSPRVQPRATTGTRAAAVGAVTADAVTDLIGWPVAFVPVVETAVELGRTLPIAPTDRVLLPQSALAGPALAAILSGRGGEVTTVVAYETTTGAGGVDMASLLASGEVDAVCLTSGSTARGLLERLGGVGLPGAVRVACIGPETADAARSLGLRVEVVPARPTMEAMVRALADSFAADGAR